MPESQSRDKAEGERAACSRCPHLTPRREAVIFRYRHGLRCRGPLGHGAECRFSRQQTTTAPSKPLEAAAPRPAHRCFDSHSPATTALDSPIAAAMRWTPSLHFGCRAGREERRTALLPREELLSLVSLCISPGMDSLPQGPQSAWGMTHPEGTGAAQRGQSPRHLPWPWGPLPG